MMPIFCEATISNNGNGLILRLDFFQPGYESQTLILGLTPQLMHAVLAFLPNLTLILPTETSHNRISEPLFTLIRVCFSSFILDTRESLSSPQIIHSVTVSNRNKSLLAMAF
jgi:hypothetical protein